MKETESQESFMAAEQFTSWIGDFSQTVKKLTTLQRNLVIDRLLSLSDPGNLYHLSTHLESLMKRDFLVQLPWNVREKLLCLLDVQTLATSRQVSKAWKERIDGSVRAWQSACKEVGAKMSEAQSNVEDYYRLCRHAYTMRKKLRNGTAFDFVLLCSHDVPFHFVHYHKGKILTGSNQSVLLYEATTGLQLKSFETHSFAALKLSDSYFATAAYDATVVLWDLDDGHRLKTFRGHTSAVLAVDMIADLLVSGSADSTVKVWSISKESLLKSLRLKVDRWVKEVKIVESPRAEGYHIICMVRDNYVYTSHLYHIWQLSLSLDVLSEAYWQSSDPALLPGFLCHLNHPPQPHFLFALSSLDSSGCILIPADLSRGGTSLKWFHTGSVHTPVENYVDCCLMASGTRYVMLGSETPDCNCLLHIVEWEYADIFKCPGCNNLGCYEAPRGARFGGRLAVYAVGETDWLFGIDEENTQGNVLFMSVGADLIAVRWRENS